MGPILSIFVDWAQEKVVKPNVSFKIRIESTCKFKVKKKIMPFETKTSGHIAPQSFNSNIMDTSTSYKSCTSSQQDDYGGNEKRSILSDLPHMYEPHLTPNLSSIQAATSRFSVPWSPRTRWGMPWAMLSTTRIPVTKSWKSINKGMYDDAPAFEA